MAARGLRFSRGGAAGANAQRKPLWLRVLVGVVIALVLYAALGFLVIPWVARSQVEKILGEQLSRPVTVEKVAFNPFSLRLNVSNVTVGARDGDGSGGAPLFRLAGLDVDAAWSSLTQRAPVLSSVKLSGPQLSLTRLPDGRYSIQDLLDKWSAPKAEPLKPDTGVPGFSITNIELDDGRIDVDDQLKKLKHEVAALGLKVPFISSLPINEEVKVEPHIEATINGSKFLAAGTTEPFSNTRESSIDVNLDDIDLTELVAYSPQALPVKLGSGKLGLKVKIQFQQPPNGKPALSVEGEAALSGLDVRETGGEPLLKLANITAAGLKLKPFDNDYRVGSVVIDGFDGTVHRRDGQQVFFESIVSALQKKEGKGETVAVAPAPAAGSTAKAGTSTATATAPAAPTPLHWQVDTVKLQAAKVDFADAMFKPKPLAVRLDPLTINVTGLSSDAGAALNYQLQTETAQKETLTAEGKAVISPLDVEGKFKLHQVALKTWWWMADSIIAAEPVDGKLGVDGNFQLSMPQAGMQLKVTDFGVALSQLILRQTFASTPASGPAAAVAPADGAEAASASAPEPAATSESAGSKSAGSKAADSKASGAKLASSKLESTKLANSKLAGSKPAGTQSAASKTRVVAATAPAANEAEFVNIPELRLTGSSLDLGARSVTIGSLESKGGQLRVRKDGDGRYNLARLMKTPQTSAQAPVAAAPGGAKAPESAGAPWQVRLGHALFDQYVIDLHDDVAGKAADVRVDNLRLGLDELTLVGDQPKGAPGKLDLQARFNQKGSLNVSGPLALSPLSTKLAIDARNLSVLPVQPFFTPYVNAVISNGRASAKGEATVEMPVGKPSRILWKGDAGIDEFAALTRQSNRDLLRWKSLQVKGIDLVVEPLQVKVDNISLAELYSRLILSADGRFNLQDLLVKNDAPGASGSSASAQKSAGAGTAKGPNAGSGASASASTPARGGKLPAASATAGLDLSKPTSPNPAAPDAAAGAADSQAPSSPEQKAEMLKQVEAAPTFGSDSGKSSTVKPPAPSGPPPNIRIGKITFTNGNLDFSDFFVKPNYSANLTGLTGSISQISPDTAGEVLLKGRIDNAGSVDVSGKLNPFSTAMTMDIKADARDIDLPRLSPYSVKYIGYGIDKGKLSAVVNYKIVDRKLTAENKVVLDQFTLGDKVPSPTALNLPVQFALSLLKDRNGVIDVELPVSGSIDDPQFSIGGIVMRLIANLVVKAVTSPFSLLSGLGGGNSAELSQVPFEPGLATLEPETVTRLEKLSKALQDRPALRLDVAGLASTARDTDALNKLRLQRRVKGLKVKEDVSDGGESTKLDQVTLTPDEYERLLRQLYKAAPFDKPRNAIGFVKDVPVADMEKMLIDNAKVGETQLRDLANRRAQSIKDWLSQNGNIGTERLYITSSKIDAPAASGNADGAKAVADAGAALSLK